MTRNYGATANDKANKLIQKLLFATASVVVLVFVALGPARSADRRRRRPAHARGDAVRLVGLGLHAQPRVAVRAHLLHRHPGRRRHRGRREHPPPHALDAGTLGGDHPRAVDEVGGPTILATFTVIAALLPMAFVSGLMGPYMSPIPINASMGMLLSLAIAFVVTPWLALQAAAAARARHAAKVGARLAALLRAARRGRSSTGDARAAQSPLARAAALRRDRARRSAAGASSLVVLKMLPFDNKSEFQVVVDMPAGTPVEATAACCANSPPRSPRCPR